MVGRKNKKYRLFFNFLEKFWEGLFFIIGVKAGNMPDMRKGLGRVPAGIWGRGKKAVNLQIFGAVTCIKTGGYRRGAGGEKSSREKLKSVEAP